MNTDSLLTSQFGSENLFAADIKIVDENWVAADLEIINATPVIIDLEINSGDEIISGFISSFQPNIRLMLGFPLPMCLT